MNIGYTVKESSPCIYKFWNITYFSILQIDNYLLRFKCKRKVYKTSLIKKNCKATMQNLQKQWPKVTLSHIVTFFRKCMFFFAFCAEVEKTPQIKMTKPSTINILKIQPSLI